MKFADEEFESTLEVMDSAALGCFDLMPGLAGNASTYLHVASCGFCQHSRLVHVQVEKTAGFKHAKTMAATIPNENMESLERPSEKETCVQNSGGGTRHTLFIQGSLA